MTFNILSYYYPKKEIYLLAHRLGRRLSDFLGERIFSLFLDSNILILGRPLKKEFIFLMNPISFFRPPKG